jgi:hypothetical protein
VDNRQEERYSPCKGKCSLMRDGETPSLDPSLREGSMICDVLFTLTSYKRNPLPQGEDLGEGEQQILES